jgi:excisionase family DNA binding protein
MAETLGGSAFMRRWTEESRLLALDWGLPAEETEGLVALFVSFLRMHATLGVFTFGPLTISVPVVEELGRSRRWGIPGDYEAFTKLLQQELSRSDRPLDEVSALLALMKIRRGLPGRVFGELGVSPDAVEDFARTGKTREAEMERLYTPEEAAEYLQVHVGTVRNWIRSGRLPASRLAGQRALRVRASDLAAVLEPIRPAVGELES